MLLDHVPAQASMAIFWPTAPIHQPAQLTDSCACQNARKEVSKSNIYAPVRMCL